MSFSLPRSGRLAAVLMLALLSTAAFAQWQWKDAQGRMQFSDMPPPAGVPDKDILKRPPGARMTVVPYGYAASQAASAAAAASAASAARKDAEQQAKAKRELDQMTQQRRDEQRRLDQQRADNCKRAQDQLQVIDSGIRLTMLNDKGEQIYLDDNQRVTERNRVLAVMATDCR